MNPLEEARKYLRSCGIESPDDDVKLMAACAAGLPLRDALGARPPHFTLEQERKFRRLVARRGERREPLPYLVGTEEFLDIELRVNTAVLVPRPSTESLALRALALPKGRFLDIGTGSGVLAIVLARAGWTGTATDLSARALDVARDNAARLGVAERIAFEQSDLWPAAEGRLDLVLSNPPYVSTSEMEVLTPEVRHEPREALQAGAEGLDVIRRILAGAAARAPRLLLEIGSSQARRVRELALHAGAADVQVLKDLDGFDRVVEVAWRS